MAEGRAARMYKDSPKMKRGESGHMEVSRKEHKEEGSEHATKKEEMDGLPTAVRHSHERHMMHAKHEHEHMMHDHHGGDKAEMHKRHQMEMADMHSRHEGEDTGGEMISKVESDKGE